MPISVPYSWSQTASRVEVVIPLKGSSPKCLDVFLTPAYLKASFHPYLVQLDLPGSINVEASKAVVRDGEVRLTLVKEEAGCEWESVCLERSKEVLERREQSIQEQRKNDEKLQERKKSRQQEEERRALRTQMALEDAQRQHLEDLKSKEKSEAERDVYQALAAMGREQSTNLAHIDGGHERNIHSVYEVEEEDSVYEADVKGEDRAMANETEEEQSLDLDDREEESPVPQEPQQDTLLAEDREELMYVPAPRQGAKVPIGFTPRLFPTPKRESKAQEEEDWIIRNRSHLHKNALVQGRLPKDARDLSESDPVWLKGKGDDLYRSGDFLSAINAYSAALDSSPDNVSVLANRAACYMRAGQEQKCIDDCAAGLDLLLKLPGGSDVQKRLLARRGAAYCAQGHFKTALEDYKSALELDPTNVELQRDAARLDVMARSAAIKLQADGRIVEGDTAGALELYTAAMELTPLSVACVSNRAACHLAQGEYKVNFFHAIGWCSLIRLPIHLLRLVGMCR
jgi:dyslexia susceptibility 1 candidate gene 1 protein